VLVGLVWQVLVLDSNEFVDFPESICFITTLEVLQFSRNSLEHIPERIAMLQKLQVPNIT
jgi:Leucine-rich repeat (LRR) protein